MAENRWKVRRYSVNWLGIMWGVWDTERGIWETRNVTWFQACRRCKAVNGG